MTSTHSSAEWAQILDGEELPALEVAERLADARDLSVGAAQEAVYAALEDGPIVEDDEAGGFGAVRLAAACDGETERQRDTEPDGQHDGETERQGDNEPRGPTVETWADAGFDAPEAETWPPAHRDVDAWMLRNESKAPWSPWADPDAPVECARPHEDRDDDPATCAECGHSARYKWGSDGSREHVHADYETALEWREKHPDANGDLVFIQREADPFAFVDGDDVRDPETGEVHPEFLRILDALGLSYADVSTSGGGAHVMYRGELPDGVKQAVFEIDDEPFGSHDEGDRPTVEIYDGKHVCIATGDHVPGSGLQVREWDADALAEVLNEYGELPDRERPAEGYEAFDADEYEPGATDADETTDDIRDVFAALNRLDARRVADRTIVDEWIDPSGVDDRAFVPTWAPAGYEGTANFVNRRAWTDTGERGGYGSPACMAAIDAGLVSDRNCPEAVRGETWHKAVDHLRDLGFPIPELEEADEEYDDDPREADAVVDPQRAWDAAGRIEPGDLEHPGDLESAGDRFACPTCGEGVDIVRAVAVERGLVDGCDDDLGSVYPEAYSLARDEYGAPLPRYLTTADAVAEFDAVLSVIREIGFFNLDRDALRSDVTEEGHEVGGEAVRALNPAWRESESEASVLVFPSGTVWDAETERTLDALRFVALDAGMALDPAEPLEGDLFVEAYRLAREEYGAPLPRWEPAAEGKRAVVPMLPPAEQIVDEPDAVAVGRDRLEEAREEVEALVRDAGTDASEPAVVTSLPATGKTTGTIKSAADRPTSYLAPRKELQEQAMDTAAEWGVNAMLLPVFSDAAVDRETVDAAVAHVREAGKDCLRGRSAILDAVEGEVFTDTDDDDETVALNRATCGTADGEHGEAWALVVHVARVLGYTPREIHHYADGLFGATLPCGEDCRYSAAWECVRDGEHDLLVGSYGHAHVESVRTYYDHAGGEVKRLPRTVVYDEFPGEAHTREFGEEAVDHATWLASALSADIDDRHDLLQADLWSDEFVRAWLAGEGDEVDAVADVVDALGDCDPDTDAEIAIPSPPGGGELRRLVERAIEAADAGADDADGMLQAARRALIGGADGAQALAAWADDGYAHPDAHHLLCAVITPAAAAETTVVETSAFAFDDEATDGTRLDRVATDKRTTVLLDRNHHGAILHDPPARTAGNGEPAPILGLDATGRERLWSLALGEPVTTVDIHDMPAERAAFLRDALGLQVVRCSDAVRPYEGSPHEKDLDGDVALVEAIAESFTGVQAARERDGEPTSIGDPAVVTTKGVRGVLEDEDRLDGRVSTWENYGNLTGANDLGDNRLAALLGSQHYGDHAVERMAALAGEEVVTDRDQTGYGAALDYQSEVANTYLQHMREDQVMQATLRFARGNSGATVFARTCALRDDLPVVGRGQVAETWTETAAEIAQAWRLTGETFTRADVAGVVDVSGRQVRRVLAEFVEAGYLSRVAGGPGEAHTYIPEGQPGAGEVDLPEARPADPGREPSTQYYTWNVRVSGVNTTPHGPPSGAALTIDAPPAPGTVAEGRSGADPPPG